MASNTETATARIFMDGKQAGIELKKLEDQTGDLKREIIALNKEGKSKEVDARKKDLKVLQAQTRKLKVETFDTEKVLKNLNGASLDQLKASHKKLTKQVSLLNRETDEYTQKSGDLKKIATQMKKVRGEMSATRKSSGGLLQSAKGLLPAFGFAAILGGAVALGKKVFSMVQETMEYRKQVQQLTGEEGQSLADLTSNIEASSGTFKKEFDEMVIANNTLAKTFDISQTAANNLIDKGFIAGADASGEFLDMLKEYPTQFKAAGLSAEQSIALMAQSVKDGVYSDKGADAIKEGTLRLREMTQATRDALEGVGISSTQLESYLKKGTITYFDAIQQVSTKLDELPPQSVGVGTALADIFGGAGEDAGLEYITMLGKVDTSLDNMVSKTGESGAAQMKLLEANKKLSGAWSDLMGTGTGTITALTAGAKGLLADGILGLIGGLKGVRDWFIDIYNESTAFRAWIQGLLLNFNVVIDVIKLAFNGLWVNLKSGGKLIKAIFTFDIDGIKDAISGWKDGMTTAVVDGAKEIGADFADAYNETVKGKIDPVTQKVDTVATMVSKKINSESNESDGGGTSGVDLAAMEKHNAEIEKLQEELTQSGIANLKDGIEKERALENARWDEQKQKPEDQIIHKDDLSAEELEKNAIYNDLIIEQTVTHNDKIAEIDLMESERKKAAKDLEEVAELELKNAKAESDEEEWDAKMELAQERYDQELEAADGNRAKILAAETKFAKEKKKLEGEQIAIKKKTTKGEKVLVSEKLAAAQESLSGITEIAGKETAVGKAAFIANKAVAMANILMNLGIGESKTAAIGFPQNIPMIIGFIAQAVGIISAVKGVGFKEGGDTGSYGRSDVAGVVHGEEYVIPAELYKDDPLVSSLVASIIEPKRSGIRNIDYAQASSTVDKLNGYQEGGEVETLSENETLSSTEMHTAIENLNSKLDKGIKAYIVYSDIEDKKEEVDTIRDAVNL